VKRWWLVIVLLLSLGMNLGLLASRPWRGSDWRSPAWRGAAPTAEGPPGEPGDRLPRFAERMAAELGLRGEQRDAFVERQRVFFEQTLDARDRFLRLQAELRREVTAEEPDREAVDELLARISEAHVDLERAFVDNLLDSREILDPEQEQRLMRLLQRLRSSRERERLRRGERPPWGERWGPGRERLRREPPPPADQGPPP
jgi:Spy/CpxP family protein refolding chaperone